MSKRILGLVIVMGALVASNAFASRARDLVLGTGDAGVVLGGSGSNGTFYTDDAYNMFYNPAYVNDYKNWAIIEKSNYSQGSSAVSTLPTGNTFPTGTTAIPAGGATAQGGFATSFNNINMVVFFNRQDDLADAIYFNGQSMRPIELLIGSDMNNIKWGLGVSYAASTATDARNVQNTTSVNDIVVRAGLSFMDFEPFVDVRVTGTDNNVANVGGTNATQANPGLAAQPANKGFEAGFRYHWGEWTPYAVYKTSSYNGTSDYRAYGIGLGRTMKATEAVKLAYSVAWFRQMVGGQPYLLTNAAGSTEYVGGTINGTSTPGTRSVLPLNITVEADALTWLTLRAGFSYNFLDQVASSSFTDNTSARIGATAHAGKVDFDFAVGQSSSPGVESSGDASSESFDIAHNFFTAASLAYHW